MSHDPFFYLIDFFRDAERQGPGSAESTQKALAMVGGLPPDARILDIGAGTGAQTVELAAGTDAHITAVDLSPEFLEEMEVRLQAKGLRSRVTPLKASMEDLPFADGHFDVVWSEGAIYHLGFERGVREWRRLLRPGGYLAVTEVSWLTDWHPEEIDRYWEQAYPEIGTIEHKLALLHAHGYEVVGHFVLPEECWTAHYYEPVRARGAEFLRKHGGNAMAEAVVQECVEEADIYDRFKEFYGYVFYVAHKR